MSEPRVTHVITGLERGGAETLLVRVLEQIEDASYAHSIVSLTGKGTLGPRIERLGVPIEALGMPALPRPRDPGRLARALRRSAPDVVQTWMLHSNVLGGVVARASLRAPVAWGVHVSTVETRTLGARAAAVQRLEGLLSWVVPTRIVACSRSSSEVMARLRYDRRRIVEIANGFELPRVGRDPRTSEAVRAELGIPAGAEVVGHVARFHPVKDHETLLRAAALVLERRPSARFVLCGAGVNLENPRLRGLVEPLGDAVLLLGERDDVPRLLDAFDLLASSSAGEALPLAIGEAMANGVPVAATRCGDSQELVGDTGALVPVRDPVALAEGIVGLLELPRPELGRLGQRARERIAAGYSLEEMMRRYRELWRGLAGRSARGE